MKTIFLLFNLVVSSLVFAQETMDKDSIKPPVLTENKVMENTIFHDQDLALVHHSNSNGYDWLGIKFGDKNAIEITKNGNLKVENRIFANQLNLSNVPFQENINPNYLVDLDSLEKQIKKNRKLPNFPSNEELKQTGINVAEFQMKLLKEIEELTLIIIEQNKRIESLEKEVKKMKIVIVNDSSR